MKPIPMQPTNSPLRRRNLRTAWALVAFALAVAASVFGWRALHHAPLMPTTSGYAAAYGQ
jgi:hypothetical protein